MEIAAGFDKDTIGGEGRSEELLGSVLVREDSIEDDHTAPTIEGLVKEERVVDDKLEWKLGKLIQACQWMEAHVAMETVPLYLLLILVPKQRHVALGPPRPEQLPPTLLIGRSLWT